MTSVTESSSASLVASIAEGLGYTTGSKPPSKDPEQSKTFWQYYQCVKAPPMLYGYNVPSVVCSKTRVPFFEMTDHRYSTRAPSILPDTLQREWIWWSHPGVGFWPPSAK